MRAIPALLPAAILAWLCATPLPAREAPLSPVPLRDVTITGGFWGKRLETDRTVTIPHLFAENEKTGRVANFERAAGRLPGEYEGRRFNDTDVYKAIEAAAYTLAWHPDPALRDEVLRLVRLIAASQQPDGYLFPARTIDPAHPAPGVGPERWMYLYGSHELYDAGHLYEAAVALARATGDRGLLEVARRNADLLLRTFGPAGIHATSGHPEVELALDRLSRETGDRRYLRLSRFFLDQRGRPHDTTPYPEGSPFAMYNDPAYRQDHLPVLLQRRAVGHAVRAMYLYSAMTDMALLGGDERYARAAERLWDDVVSKRLYVTGGLGARGEIEGFGGDYVLPNATAYSETCASVGSVLWNERLFLLTGEGKYIDVLERTLYNAALDGVSLSGDRFFYDNPLASDGTQARQAYFEVACCPANIARLIAQMPRLLYARGHDSLVVALFADSRARTEIAGVPVAIEQTTAYPWRGRVVLRVSPARPVRLALRVRVPGWATGARVPGNLYRELSPRPARFALSVNGRAARYSLQDGFATIRRTFRKGDRVELDLPMDVRRLAAYPEVRDDAGRVALERGPLVYCVEQADNGPLARLALPRLAPLRAVARPDLLGGTVVIQARQPSFRAIPYFLWNNRGPGQMEVWIPEGPAPGPASVSAKPAPSSTH